MGSLALWRGVEGVGKGMGQLAEQRMADESYEKRAGIDEARAQRLEKLKQEHTLEVTGVQQEGAMARQVAGDEAAMSRTEAQQRAMDERAAADRESRERTTAMAGESRETVERMGIEAGKYDKTSGTSSDPRYKAMYDRYEKTKLTQEQASEQYPNNPIFNQKKETPVIYDKHGAMHYIQQGTVLIPANGDGDFRKAPSGAEQKLIENPGMKNAFLRDYGYLPADFLQVMRDFDLAQAGYGTFGNPREE